MDETGKEIYELIKELYPICRSITGNGVRQSLRILQEHIPLEIREVPSGTRVLDWTIPDEWNIRDAWIADSRGNRVVDFKKSNLHVVNYSVPLRRRTTRVELLEHLHTLPDEPDWIPYRTSYYRRTWGFCLTETQRRGLVADEYEVCIDSTLEPGHLTYGELFLSGRLEDEILISCHVCHPSLCDDNLSGVAISTFLARHVGNLDRRHSFRFLFIPGTIGAITWLAQNRERAGIIRHGLTLVCLGDQQKFTYKKTFGGHAEIDRTVQQVLRESGRDHEIIDFFPYGYDERQFNSPGFRLPVGSFMRGRHGQFPEYHTSADNLDFVTPEYLGESLDVLGRVIHVLESNVAYRNLHPYGEPQLGKHGIYREMGDADKDLQMAMLWVLNLSDGRHDLLNVCENSLLPFATVNRAAKILARCGLIQEVPYSGAVSRTNAGTKKS